MKLPRFADLASLAENDRITVIGNTIMATGQTAGVVVDDLPGKAERYITKLTQQFPFVVVLAQWKGPVKGMVTIKFGRMDKHGGTADGKA